MTHTNYLFSLLIGIIFIFIPNIIYACDSSEVTMDGIVDNGNGTYDATFTICFAGDLGSNGPTHGVDIIINGTTVNSVIPTSLTSNNSTTINSSITGGTVSYGDWSDGVSNFVTQTDPQECFTIILTLNGYPTDWEVYGQEYYEITTGPPPNQGPAGCEVTDVFPSNCPANAGTNTSPAIIETCAGTDINVTATGTTNTNLGANPCIGWGFWIQNDPLGIFTGTAGIGDLPTGGMPTDDPNFVGTWTSVDYPLANGENATLPAEDNGVTYYIAPITLSNCEIGEINTGCFDVGNPTQVYFNPAITYTSEISCDNIGLNTLEITVIVNGGHPSVDGSNFTITNDGDGSIPSPITVVNGGSFTINAIPDGGNISFTIMDDLGCSETTVINASVDASVYCNNCGTDAGTTTSTQTGDGNTTANSGNGSQGPFILCHDDQLSLTSNGDFTLPTGAFPGGPPEDDGTAGLMYTMYAEVPSTGAYSSDPAWTNIFFTGDPWNFNNDGALQQILECLTTVPITDYTFWAVPIAADATNYPNADADADGCFDEGAPVQITLLPEILSYSSESCDGMIISLSGGFPAIFGGNFTITNTGAGDLSSVSIQNEGTIQLTNMNQGDAWSITVEDANGCPQSFSGTYNFAEPSPSFTTLASYCEDDVAVNLIGTPLPGGTVPAEQSYTINIIGDGFINEIEWEVTDAGGGVMASSGGFVNLGEGEHQSTIIGPFDTDDCPLIFTITDVFSDGQGGCVFGTVDGCFEVIDNVTGSVIGGECADWGASQTFPLICRNDYDVTATFTGAGVADNGDGTAVFTPEDAGGGSHDIVYTVLYNNGECSYTSTQTVEVFHTPVAIMSGGETFCNTSFTTAISITFDDDATAPFTIVYNIDNVNQTAVVTSDNPYTFIPTVAGTYGITSFVDDNCTGNGGGEAIYAVVNNMTANAGEDLTLCEGHTAYLGAMGENGATPYVYNWSNGLGTGQSQTVLVGTISTTYTVTVTDDDGCTATDQMIVAGTVDADPTITCPSNQSVNNDATVCEATVTLVDPMVSDDCAPPTLTAANGVIMNYYGSYNGHYYYVTQQNITPISNDASGIPGTTTEAEAFAAVQAAAQEFGADGYIATVDNALENAFINNAAYHYGNLVIGLNDEVAEGAMNWTGSCVGCGGGGSGYLYWNAGEPNDAGGEDYVEIQASTGVWNDIDLNSSIREAIVEFNTMPEEVTFVCSPANPFPVGTTTITCTATDWAGNTADCMYDIIVADNESPIANCNNITINVSSGPVTITTADIDDNSSDNCAIQSLTLSEEIFDCENVGINNVILTVLDVNGNSTTCTARVTVEDVNLEFIRD